MLQQTNTQNCIWSNSLRGWYTTTYSFIFTFNSIITSVRLSWVHTFDFLHFLRFKWSLFFCAKFVRLLSIDDLTLAIGLKTQEYNLVVDRIVTIHLDAIKICDDILSFIKFQVESNQMVIDLFSCSRKKILIKSARSREWDMLMDLEIESISVIVVMVNKTCHLICACCIIKSHSFRLFH